MPADDDHKKAGASLFSSGVVLLSTVIVAALVFFSVYRTIVPEVPVRVPAWSTADSPEKLELVEFASQISGYSRLKALGFTPKVALDLGASSGHWGAFVREQLSVSPFLLSISKKNASIATGFPSVVVDAVAIKRPKHRLGLALGSNERQASYTVDDVCKEIPPASLLRIQSMEDAVEVLEGASNVLSNAEVVIVELHFMDGYANKYTKPLVLLDYLNKKGFQLHDIFEYLKFLATEYSKNIDRAAFVLVRKNSNLIPSLHKAVKIIS